MILKKKIVLIISIILMVSMVRATTGKYVYVHHDLKVTLEPEKQFIRVTDTIHLPETIKGKKIHFLLHGDLTITSTSADVQINKETGELKSGFFGINTPEFEIKKEIPLNHYSISFLKESEPSFILGYEGKIHHPIKKIGAEYARGFSETPGIICDQGAYLAGASFWVPWFNDDLVTFKLESTAQVPWDMVSQGKRSLHEQKNGKQITVWDSPEPMDEVYLIAAKFKEYGLKAGKVEVMAFLRGPDDNLANKYLETTGQYLEMYEKMIGLYPFSKFALIENFWETGYGMSSFTLLGEKVIRFPFILHSSYPHELLHNWWGNSVFVDYESGNWCEGITVYLADHLIKEQRGQGEEYRKTTLQGYTHYAANKKEEFPLTRFKARYDSLSSAIGYGKSMMLFHMLRQQVGDALFKKALQHFYKNNQYRRASFADVQKSFETVTGSDFEEFFHQWVTRTGAPEIRLSGAAVEKKENRYLLRFSLRQAHEQEPYAMRIPAAITLEGREEAVIKQLDTAEKKKTFEFSFDQRPLRIDVDPQFDVFRILHTGEIPPTLSNAFGADAVLILLPSGAPEAFFKGYEELADAWASESEGKIEVKKDSDVSSLPEDKAVWLFGWENIRNDAIQTGIAAFPAEMNSESITIDGNRLPVHERSIIAAVKNSKNPTQVVVLLSTDRPAALPGLGRKLPHYGKYSYLAFEGDEPTNTFKGQWAAVNSPMSVIPDKSPAPGAAAAKLPRRQPLARLAPLFSSERMTNHIKYLASEELEGRGLNYKGLEKAAHYIAMAFKNAGLQPGGDNSYYQSWDSGGPIPLRNVIGIIPGKNPSYKDQSVILCAHYDHLGLGERGGSPENKGKIHFGADDNASGVAVMLELAHTLGKTLKPERSIVFIAFTGEESGLLGSSYYVKNLQAKNKKQLEGIMGVVNLDTVGRLTDQGKLMVIGGSSAREWRFIFMGIGYTTGVETELIPQELDASDQVSFIKAGIPGIQLFSGAHLDYHKPTDTVDKIEAAGLVKVAAAAREAVVYLSERKEPLTVTIKGAESSPAGPAGSPSASASTGERRARTGFMPDFAFSGKGVKIGMVSPGSPAAEAGLKKDDVIIKMGDVEVADLTEYSNALKAYKPGDTVTIVYIREGKEFSAAITLAAR
jgi:aminopeptidase N